MSQITLTALPDFPLVQPGDDLAKQILESLETINLSLNDTDVLVLAQKIVSKSENRYAYLNDIVVGEEAQALSIEVDKDPRLVELILSESKEVVRHRPGVVIVEHNLGYVHANAGIDKSNISSDAENPRVLLLPINSDASADKLRKDLFEKTGKNVFVIINDSAGRAWRNGTVGMAIGSSGFAALEDLIGLDDLFDRPLEISQVAVADELAAGASFLMGQAAEGSPVVLIRGAQLTAIKSPSVDTGTSSLIREKSMDLFR
ncbi:MAG: coenzyme F420-0:L-glutamate ligase/coenzyme F420-1:gamma-L-glutamate ligase [Oceanicoccus sp.]|jgi:coenzyme F420-0:L-glutamate ligase/coenzyme F420-1:gamma-L-glutamate ligase